MLQILIRTVLLALVSSAFVACAQSEHATNRQSPAPPASNVVTAAAGVASVNAKRLIGADKEAGAWMSHGRTYSEQRFSPLAEIDDKSVRDLGLTWSYDLATVRGIEATSIVVDGVMYTTSAWSIVHAQKVMDVRPGGSQRKIQTHLLRCR